MEKLVYALWRPAAVALDPWCEALRTTTATELAARGARGIQVNVADAAVAPALVRMSTFDRPIEGVVSLWVDRSADGPRSALDDALAAVSDRLAGYLVTESAPAAGGRRAGAPRRDAAAATSTATPG